MPAPVTITIKLTVPMVGVKDALGKAADIAEAARLKAGHGNTPSSIKSVTVSR